MKLTRPDLVSMVLTALSVVGIVVLAMSRLPIPDVLTYVAIGALGIGGGTALNTSGTVDVAAQRITEALSSVEALVADLRAGKLSAAADDVAAAAVPVVPAIPPPALPIGGFPVGAPR